MTGMSDITESCDVIVVGAGPAGVAAAIGAARAGASVRLIESQGCLGGVWTSGLLAWILDSKDKTGFLVELLDELHRRGARRQPEYGGIAFDVEAMKLLLEDLCLRAGVRVRLHTFVTGAQVDADRRLVAIETHSKSGRETWNAKVFIDTTGDGDLAARAGCRFDIGRPTDGATQPMSLLFLIGGVRYEDIHPYVHDKRDKIWREDSQRIIEACKNAGFEPSYGAPVLFRIHDDLYALMANHEYEASALDAQSITDATMRARAEVHRIANALRAISPAWSGLRLVTTASHIGVREGRRIRGLYTLTADDLTRGARFDDAVCRVNFKVDIHAMRKSEGTGYGNAGVHAQPYDIPLRAMIAADVDGLMMAGRCISGDYIAHASYRVTGNAVAMGEAAGRHAARCALADTTPHRWAAGLTRSVAG